MITQDHALSFLEYFLLFTSLGTAAFSVRNLTDAIADQRALDILRSDAIRGEIAQASIVSEASRLLKGLLFGAAGVAAILTPNPSQATVLGLIVFSIFNVSNGLVFLASFLGYRVRRNLLRTQRSGIGDVDGKVEEMRANGVPENDPPVDL